MTITPSLFEAFLKCPTKCWLRFTDETPTGNNYAEWVQTESESYRIDAAKRLLATVPADECGPLPGSSRREESPSLAENLKAAQWRVATDVSVHTELRSSRGHEALTYLIFQNSCIEMSLLTSAATDNLPASVPLEPQAKAAAFAALRERALACVKCPHLAS